MPEAIDRLGLLRSDMFALPAQRRYTAIARNRRNSAYPRMCQDPA
jgi:hypothetical protein